MLRKYFYLFFAFICFFLHSNSHLEAKDDFSIVFIHIGDRIPAYAETALLQARTFNPDCPIIMLANEKAINGFTLADPEANITFISCESLTKSVQHKRFIKKTKWNHGFMRYTSERFLYLCDLMNQHNLQNIFHLEYDNMLYVNLAELFPVFKQQYKGIAATFDNDQRCIPGFVFISNKNSMNYLAMFFAEYAHKGFNDMEVLAKFKTTYGNKFIDNLPIITKKYTENNAMVSPAGHKAMNVQKYCNNFEAFQSIFDAAALGQYLGGIDPNNGPSSPGFINESCVFNPSLLLYEWINDSQGRKIPYIIYSGEKYRINNLHIHCKNLGLFTSK